MLYRQLILRLVDQAEANAKVNLRERFGREITMAVHQRQCVVILTLLSTPLLVKVCPRSLDDAMSAAWYVYLVLIAILARPLFVRTTE